MSDRASKHHIVFAEGSCRLRPAALRIGPATGRSLRLWPARAMTAAARMNPFDVLFADPVTTEGYCGKTLRQRPLGGSQASVVRVAEGLARSGLRVAVAQRCWSGRARVVNRVHYSAWEPRGESPALPAKAVVVLATDKLVPCLRRVYPHASMFLWLQSYPGRHRRRLGSVVRDNDVTVVAVSRTHAAAIRGFLLRHDPSRGDGITVRTLFNPIDDDLRPDRRAHDPDKLVFFSSPHKGLDEVYHHFFRLRLQVPTLSLVVADPGYFKGQRAKAPPGVIAAGPLSHRQALEHVREALCVFYPQTGFEETFGLVFTEANAVGTPVIAHPAGAAPEVLGDPRQLVDATDADAVAARVKDWRAGSRPVVDTATEFRATSVVQQWRELLA